MKQEMATELQRKGLHLFAIIVPLFLLILSDRVGLIVIVASTALALLFEVLRRFESPITKFYNGLFHSMLRKHEMNGSMTGATYFFLSLAVSYLVFYRFFDFSLKTVVWTYVVFMLGDAVAAIVGRFFGTLKIYKSKTFEGFMSCFLLTGVILLFVLDSKVEVLVLAFSVSFFELIVDKLDDNFFVPIFTLMVMLGVSVSA